jgi:hypothetical protein
MKTYTYQGKRYTRPDKEPRKNSDVSKLHKVFFLPLEGWLKEVNRIVNHVVIDVSEGIRTKERQLWLFSVNRDKTNTTPDGKHVTWTLDSNHFYGLAADLRMIRKSTGEAIWGEESWEHVYKTVPLREFGLVTLAPAEFVHVEHIAAKNLIANGIIAKGE